MYVNNAAPFRAGQVYPVLMKAGYYYTPISGVNNQSGTTNELRAFPFVIPPGKRLDSIAVDVTTNAVAFFRMGAWYDDGTGYPGARIFDAGQVSTNSIGMAAITIDEPIVPGVVWFGGVVQNVTGTPSLRGFNTGVLNAGQPTLTTGAGMSGLALSGVSGTLPTQFTAGATLTNAAYRLQVRSST